MKTSKWLRAGVCAAALAGLVGCETLSEHKGAAVGAGAGGLLGAAAGAAIGGSEHRAAGAVIGGVVGAAGGGVAGDQLYDKKKREEAEKKAAEEAPAVIKTNK